MKKIEEDLFFFPFAFAESGEWLTVCTLYSFLYPVVFLRAVTLNIKTFLLLLELGSV
jgi:hypothetical protein